MTTPPLSRRRIRPISGASWQRDFMLLWSGSATSLLSGMSATVAAPLLALSLTGSAVSAGWVVAAGTLPQLLLHIPAGLWVDRIGTRRAMVISLVLRVVVAATVAVLLSIGDVTVWLVVAAAIVSGGCVTLHGVAEVSAVPMIVRRDRLAGAMSTNEARSHLALLIGRPLGGLLFGFSRALPYAVDAVSCLLSVYTIGMIRTERFRKPTTRTTGHAGSLTQEMGKGLARLWSDGFLRTSLIICTITNFLFQAIILLLVVLAQGQGVSTTLIGVLLAAPGFGGILGSMAAPRVLRRHGPQRVVVTCVWAWFGLVAIIAVSSHPWLWLFAWSGVGLTGAHINVAIATRQAETTPLWLLGRVVGANRLLSLGAVPLGTVCAGYVISAVGTKPTAVAVALTILVLALVVTFYRRLLSPPAEGDRLQQQVRQPRPKLRTKTLQVKQSREQARRRRQRRRYQKKLARELERQDRRWLSRERQKQQREERLRKDQEQQRQQLEEQRRWDLLSQKRQAEKQDRRNLRCHLRRTPVPDAPPDTGPLPDATDPSGTGASADSARADRRREKGRRNDLVAS
ncbi:MFS transporter [Spirillospora sp. NPDC048911]|uniref:MFS transporter n=1 Tax=Spirillospora sp. NPDC048911 TaxID=3364527 RepID=UPI003722CF7A